MDYDDCVLYSLEVYDGDIPGSDSNCMWYPDAMEYGTCMYSSMYPESWTEPEKRILFLFDTLDECCVGAFGGLGCKLDYDCDGASAGMTPSGYITNAPSTIYPTFNPTPLGGAVTRDPTPPPTPNPITPATPDPTPLPTPNPTAKGPETKPPTKSPVKWTPPAAGEMGVIDATSLTTEIKDGFENGLSGTFPWFTLPMRPWTTVTDDKTEGSFSARSTGGLERGETSDLQLAIKTSTGGVLSFDFKTDVRMPWSGCYINLDNESKKGYTFPKPDWIPLTLPIPPGDHIVMFRAWAPDSESPPSDPGVSGTIGVDNVRFMPN